MLTQVFCHEYRDDVCHSANATFYFIDPWLSISSIVWWTNIVNASPPSLSIFLSARVHTESIEWGSFSVSEWLTSISTEVCPWCKILFLSTRYHLWGRERGTDFQIDARTNAYHYSWKVWSRIIFSFRINQSAPRYVHNEKCFSYLWLGMFLVCSFFWPFQP